MSSLYRELGGEEGIFKLCKGFVQKIMNDDRTKVFFVNVDQAEHVRATAFHLIKSVGGPNKYTGKDMYEAHKGMGITDYHVDVLIELQTRTMQEQGYDEAIIKKFIKGTESHRSAVTGTKDKCCYGYYCVVL